MTISQFLRDADLENSLLVGYYGGGNFGDELLLEVLLSCYQQNGVQSASFVYLKHTEYSRYHHDFGYHQVNGRAAMLRAAFGSSGVVIGGGGLWSMDANLSIFALSLLLFILRFVARKQVYLIGVGYYASTTRLGRLSAWLAGKSATVLIARDQESSRNFARMSSKVSIDSDIGFLIGDLDLSLYSDEAIALSRGLTLGPSEVFVAIRKYRGAMGRGYGSAIEHMISHNRQTGFVLALLQPKAEFPDGAAFLQHLSSEYRNAQLLATDVNPLALVAFFRINAHRFILIAPQFHAIITAMICGIPYAPLAYDNKISELLNEHGAKQIIPLAKVDAQVLQQFLDSHIGSKT